MTEETIQERVERAQSQEMNATIVRNDPVIVQVHNEASDRIHTVVPDAVHCSCEDHTYRGEVCKHIIELLQDEGHVGDIMREAIKQDRNDIQELQAEVKEQIRSLKERMNELQEQREKISATLNALDLDHVSNATIEESLEAVSETEVRSASGAGGDTTAETFEEMISSLSGGEQ